MKVFQIIIIVTLLLSIVSLFLEQEEGVDPLIPSVNNVIDYCILTLIVIETAICIITARYKLLYIKEHKLSLLFVVLFIVLFIILKFRILFPLSRGSESISLLLILLRNTFLILKIFGRLQKFSHYVESFTIHPAQTILLSFLFMIFFGTLVLMMGFTTRDGRGLHFIDSLFTATSAVCVTGLIVVDTATHFTIWGQLVILTLIQIGGLGIMILSFFAIFALRRKISLEDKLLLSYMLSEDDMSSLAKSLKNIIIITFIIEFFGACILFAGFYPRHGFSLQGVFLAVFHSVSAFCNAGFSLFSDSLKSYRSNPLILGTVAVLIILGGLSFSVIVNIKNTVLKRIRSKLSGQAGKPEHLSLNTRVVIKFTLVLIALGMVFTYFLEHGESMKDLGLGEQYLSAFFQSVTLRTAGFNSIQFQSLTQATYLIMIVFMFIGAASGGTAGGIKINSLAVIGAYLRSFLSGEKQARIGKYSISQDRVGRSFIILLFGISLVVIGSFILALSENAPFLSLLFEATSAFGTVGLSTGITGGLSSVGKTAIILLMFLGRLGPLTILTAASSKRYQVQIEYPQGDISIG
jgi:trk system potassium uptake protein TrkH